MRKPLALAAGAAALALAATASPAAAATGDTTVEMTVADGELAIVVTPAVTGLESALVSTQRRVTAPLGLTTVTDTRAASTGWVLSASTTDFTRTLPTAATIASSNAKFYISAAPTVVLGTVSFTSTTTTASATGALVTASASGVNTVEVSPVLQVDVPNDAPTGVYAGTVTQSVV